MSDIPRFAFFSDGMREGYNESWVRSSDYDALRAERDALRTLLAECKMMLALDQALGSIQMLDPDPGIVTRQVYEFGQRVLTEARRREPAPQRTPHRRGRVMTSAPARLGRPPRADRAQVRARINVTLPRDVADYLTDLGGGNRSQAIVELARASAIARDAAIPVLPTE